MHQGVVGDLNIKSICNMDEDREQISVFQIEAGRAVGRLLDRGGRFLQGLKEQLQDLFRFRVRFCDDDSLYQAQIEIVDPDAVRMGRLLIRRVDPDI
jgi:hypothetical protein